jgi:transcriptional regulator with XRE-family HTH domain
MEDEIKNIFESAIKNGYSTEEIKNNLIGGGFDPKLVSSALSEIETKKKSPSQKGLEESKLKSEEKFFASDISSNQPREAAVELYNATVKGNLTDSVIASNPERYNSLYNVYRQTSSDPSVRALPASLFDENGKVDSTAFSRLRRDSFRQLQYQIDQDKKTYEEREGEISKRQASRIPVVSPLIAGAESILGGIINFAGEVSGSETLSEAGSYLLEDVQLGAVAGLRNSGLTDEQIDKGFLTNVMDGDIGTGLTILGPQLLQQIPQLALIAATGGTAGITLLGASSAGSALESVEKRKDMTSQEKMLYGVGAGLAEALSERLFMGDIRMIRQALGKAGVQNLTKEEIKQSLFSAVPQSVRSILEEGTEEAVASVVQQGLLNVIAGDEINPIEIAEGAIIGGIMGGSTYLLSKGMGAIGSSTTIKERAEIKKQVDDIEKSINDPETSEVERDKLEDLLTEVNNRKQDIEAMDADFYSQMTEQDRLELYTLNNNLLREARNYNKFKDKTLKQRSLDEIKRIKESINEIENRYDRQEEAGIPSPIVEGEAPIEVQPIQVASGTSPEADRVLQVLEQQEVFQKIAEAQEVDNTEAQAAQQQILNAIDEVDALDIADDIKTAYIQTLEDKFDDIEYYDNKTITTTEQVTEEVPIGAPRAGSRTIVEPEVRSGKFRLFERLNNLEVAVGTETEGQTSVIETQEDGSIDVITYDKKTKQEISRQPKVAENILGLEYVESILDDNGELTGVVMRPKTPKGEDISPVRIQVVNRPELALDIAIDARKKEIGDAPEVIWMQEYETVTREVTTKEQVPAAKRPERKAARVVLPTEAVAAEQVTEEVVEQEPTKNKRGLSSEQVTEAVSGAERLAKRLGLPTKIIAHNSRKEFNDAMDEVSKSGSVDAGVESGRFIPSANEIHLNLEDMTPEVPFHEVFHAAFVNKFAKGGQKVRKKIATDFYNGIVRILRNGSEQDQLLADAVESFTKSGYYTPEEKPEEFLAQTAGFLSTSGDKISKSTMDKLIQWLNNFIAKIAPGVKINTRGEFIDFMNSFSGALFEINGKPIEPSINLKSTNNLLDSSSRGAFTISYFEDTDQYKKFVDDGLVVNNFNLDQIAGQTVATHQPDNFMVGDVRIGDKLIVEGDGGVYFVLKFGEVWASGRASSASGIAKAINWSRENSTDGKGRMLLARGTTPKLISSTKGVKGGMQIIEEMVDRNLIPRKDFRASLIRVGKKYGIDFSGNDSMTSIKNDIEQKFMKPSDSTFAKRGSFFEDLISDISSTSTASKENIDGIRKFLGSKKRISFSKEGITSAIAELMTERMLIDLPSSHAYAIIEVENDVKVEKSKKHDSYPYSIVQVDGKRPTLYLLKDRPKAVPSLLTKDGEPATNAKVGFAQMGYGRAIVNPAIGPKAERELNKAYDELLESSSKQQVQLGIQQAQINYDIDKQLAESSSWQERERTEMERYMDLARIKIQDKLYGVIKLQEDIEYSTGKPVGLDQDFRNAEVLMHGKAASDLTKSVEKAEKVVEDIKRSGVTLDAFDQLLYALHAQERNRSIRIQRTDIAESITDLRKKNNLKSSEIAEMSGIDIETYREIEAGTAKKGITSEELNSILAVYGITLNEFYTQYSRENAGSGMTDVDAQTILKTYGLDPLRPNVKVLKPALRDAVNGVYAIIADSRERMLDYGLETLDTVVAFESMYSNYVPLRGFEGEDSASEIIGGGRSLEVRGREKRALGRKSKADSPFLTAVAQNQSTIIRARKNEVAQKLYKLAESNPNDQIWKVIDPSVNKEYEKKATSKGIKDVAKTISDYIIDDGNFAVRIDGEYKFVQFTDSRMAEALRGANVVKADFIVKYLGGFNRLLSSFITTYDPEFVLRNFSRDIQVAVINAVAEQEIEGGLLKGKDITGKIVKSVPKSIKAIFNMSKKGVKPSNEFEQYYADFLEDGAKTEWFYSKSIDELRNDVDKLVNGKGKNAIQAAGNFVERINTSVENGVRLAAYMEARKAGLSRDKAAELAKNLTVNFNKSGEWGTVANSLYLFFNASVQGTSRLVRTLKPQFKKNDDGTRSLQVTTAQKIAISMFIAGSLMSLLNEALSDDDEDGKSFYSKIPDFEKERNIIIISPNGKDYIKIPLPYGLNVFYVAGNSMADAGQGIKGVGEVATNILKAAVGSFSPINFPSSEDFSSWISKFITPTIGQIPLSLALNEDYFGRTIYNKNFPTDSTPKPESELGRKGATEMNSWIVKELNKLTGGSELRSGVIDINPDKIDFFLETLSGGAGRFALRSTSTIGNLITGNWDQIESNNVPGLRVFYGQPRKFVDLQSYFDKRIEVNQFMEEVKAGDITGPESSSIREVYRINRAVDKSLRNLRKAEKTAENIEDPEQREDRLNDIERKRYAQIANFQKAYEKYKIDKL